MYVESSYGLQYLFFSVDCSVEWKNVEISSIYIIAKNKRIYRIGFPCTITQHGCGNAGLPVLRWDVPTPIREEVIQYLLYMSKGEGNFHIIALMLTLEEEGVSC